MEFWPESGVSAASDMWFSSLLQGDTEREREKKNWRDNKCFLFCKKLCSKAVFALSDYVYNP
jgi:hypothetical protein